MPPTPAPHRRIAYAIVAFSAGLFSAAGLGTAVLSAGDWKFSVSTAAGTELGRTAMQIGKGVALNDFRIPIPVLVLMNAPLWGCLIVVPLWARRDGLDWRRDLRWSVTRRDIPMGLVIGAMAQFALIPLYEVVFLVFGERDVDGVARDLFAGVNSSTDIAFLVLMTVIAAPIAEEIVYRGLLFHALRDAWAPKSGAISGAVILSSLIFAGSHFQLIQFPGLVFFAVIAAVAVHRTGRLGTAIWAHVGFNLTTLTLLLTV